MEYNCRVIDYPTGSHVTFYKKSITKSENEEEKEKNSKKNFVKSYKNEERTIEEEKHCKSVSLSATKNRIYNIARSNTWDWFITLTFDRSRTDSSEYNMIVSRLKIFLNNLQKRKCPNLKYLIVPELHKDREHYHFHGLLANTDGLKFRFSGHYTKEGKPIYNVVNWSWGWTTATIIGDSGRASSYIMKYITKDNENILKEKNRYYCSRNVNRAQADYFIEDEETFQDIYADRIEYCKTVNIKQALQQCTYYELKD